MKIKKMLSLVAAGAITASMLSGMMVANAAGPVASKDVPVTYSTKGGIIDPEVPPTWFVQIPSAVNFDDKGSAVDATVKLFNEDKTTPYNKNDIIRVAVKSANGYKLNANDDLANNGSIDYSLTYGSKVMTGTGEVEIGMLNKTTLEVKGEARLSGVTSKIDTFTDTLTYTAQKQ